LEEKTLNKPIRRKPEQQTNKPKTTTNKETSDYAKTLAEGRLLVPRSDDIGGENHKQTNPPRTGTTNQNQKQPQTKKPLTTL